jgi:hypothetical protein
MQKGSILLFTLFLISASAGFAFAAWKTAVILYLASLERYTAYREISLVDSLCMIAQEEAKYSLNVRQSFEFKNFCKTSYDGLIVLIPESKTVVAYQISLYQQAKQKRFENGVISLMVADQ